MSLKRVLRLLENSGFARTEAEVYIYLAKKGPKRKQDLTDSLNMAEQQLCGSLQNLQSRGIVTATVEQAELFFAVPFEKVLDSIVKTNIEKANSIEKTKHELLAGWQSNINQEER